MTKIDKTVPESVKIRHVTISEVDEDGNVTGTREETPEATYAWLVTWEGTDYWVSGDIHVPMIQYEGEDPGPVVATITKVDPRDKSVKYGPADIHEEQVKLWKAAKAL